jgi:hypothetical protein
VPESTVGVGVINETVDEDEGSDVLVELEELVIFEEFDEFAVSKLP